MLGPGDILSTFDGLQLSVLSHEWVNEIWQDKFSTCPDDLPDDYAEKFPLLNHLDMLDIMKECQHVITEWIAQDDTASWTNLQEVEYKPLMAALFFYIKKAPSNSKSMSFIELGIRAADLYFSLLLIPGSNIYHIFQMALFEACLEIFTLHKCLLEVPTGRQNNRSVDTSGFAEDDPLSAAQQRSVIKQLNALLNSLRVLGGKFSFKSQVEALRLTLSMLTELTRLERTSTVDTFIRCEDRSSLTFLAKNAYLAVKDLCIELHGRVAETVRLALFRIMPNLTLIGGSNIPEMDKWPGKEQTVVRNLALWFVKSLIIPLGAPAHTPLKILIQHMCRSMTERADYRTKATDMVVAIIAELPEDIHYILLKWVFCEAMTEGANHRVVAIEIISKLIYLKQGSVERSNMADGSNVSNSSTSHVEPSTNLGEPSYASQTGVDEASDVTSGASVSSNNTRIASFCKPIDYLPLQFRRGMFGIILDRIRDDAATVRTKALTALTEIVGNRSSPTVQKLVAEVLVGPYRNLEGIDMMTKEKDFVNWTTLVAAIDQMRDPEVSKTMLPGGRCVVRQILRKCLEDRVSSRRAALSLLVQIFKLNEKWMTKDNLAAFGRHCRDRAMSIRKEMVGWVTDLMLFYPSHQALTQLWVKEVVPQVSDREIRVQENALQVLTKTILSNIKPLNKTHSSMDELPWRLLTHIAELRMRSFLVTACLLWRNSRTPELNQSRIAALVTHIGSPRDTAAWVLLSSVSEYVDIDDPMPVMNYYFETVAMGLGEKGTANLVLTTLSNTWHKLKEEKQMELMRRLKRDIKNGSVPPYIISQVVEILTSEMATLEIDMAQGKKEVAKWVIEYVNVCERHLEGCLKDSTQSSEECSKCLFYLTLLGSLADIHSGQISHETFDLLFKFVMSRHVGVNLHLSNLKAAGVITLGRLALRDNYIASRLVSGLSVLMSKSNDSVLLNNVVVSVADIGERFPNLIEPLVSALSLCLKSKHRAVKEITLVLMIDLLQEDYLKARGALLFHLLSLIVDPCGRTVGIVKFYFKNCLLVKHPQSLDQLLLTGIFHFNKNYEHPHYPRLEMTDAEEAAFDFSGAKNKNLRLNMYKFLVRDAGNIYRLRCAHFVCSVILNAFADEILSLGDLSGEQLLTDALRLLTCKEIMVDFGGKKKGEDGEDEEDGGGAGAAQAGPMKEVLSDVQKRAIADTVIPICCKLRKRLDKHQKLKRLLYRFVREVVRDYKNEIIDMFRDDKQFGHEILHEVNHTTRGQADEDDEEEEEMPLENVVNVGPSHLAVEEVVHETLRDRESRRLRNQERSDEHEANKGRMAVENVVKDGPFNMVVDAVVHEGLHNRSLKRKSDEHESSGDEVAKKNKANEGVAVPVAVVQDIEMASDTSMEGGPLERLLDDIGVVQEAQPVVDAVGGVHLLKELRVVLTDIEHLNKIRAGRSRTASAENSKDSSGASKKSTKNQTAETSEVSKESIRSSGRRTPQNTPKPPSSGASKKSMPPPARLPLARRQSVRKQLSTPTAAPKKKPLLLSSTPLVASSDEFESEISPVLQAGRGDESS